MDCLLENGIFPYLLRRKPPSKIFFFFFFFFFLALFFFFFLTIYQWPNRGLDNILIIYGVANEIVSFNIKCSKKFVIDFDLGKYLI